MASEATHEPHELLSDETRDMHRALVSLEEELEAIDWYQQRAEACTDTALREILLHNRREEVEHAMMVLEWIRRSSPDFDEHARTYLMTEEAIVGREERSKQSSSGGSAGESSCLGVGSLKGK